MSDPVTNVEIEDVLSSIRRLVSEGDKDRGAMADAANEDTGSEDEGPAEPAKPEALVLTPALRVAGSEEPEAEAPAPESDPDQETAAHGAEEDETTSEDVADTHHEPEFADSAPDMPDMAPEVDDAGDEAAPEDPVEGGAWSDRTRLEATIAELEAAVSDQPFDWEPDGSEDAEPVTWPAMGRSFEDAEDAELSEEPEVSAPEQAAQDVAEQEAPRDALQDAAWDDAPERNEEDDPAPEQIPTLGDDGDEDEADWPGDAAYAEDDLDTVLSEDGTIDEDMLRELVAEIVREELQGTLGERITRNVRKLVRREIHRVLSSQDFD